MSGIEFIKILFNRMFALISDSVQVPNAIHVTNIELMDLQDIMTSIVSYLFWRRIWSLINALLNAKNYAALDIDFML